MLPVQQFLMMPLDNGPEIGFRDSEPPEFLQTVKNKDHPVAFLDKYFNFGDILVPVLQSTSQPFELIHNNSSDVPLV